MEINMPWFKYSVRAILALLALLIVIIAYFAYNYQQQLMMILNVSLGVGVDTPSEQNLKQTISTAPGFGISLYASDIEGARMLQFTEAGHLLVSRPHQGEVILLEHDSGGDGTPDGQRVVIDGLNKPHGIAIYDGWLYIGEANQVGRVRIKEPDFTTYGAYEVVIANLTGDGNHAYKNITFGDDDLLYLSQGSTCNVCIEVDHRRGTIMTFDPDGHRGKLFATGLRNSVGMAWSTRDGELYATDNGRDLLGDDYPPCELNKIVKGGFYGWPFVNGFGEQDPDYGSGENRNAIDPEFGFAAHNAPLGITFVDEYHWPIVFKDAALVALHGSWNRTVPDGYRVVSLHWNGDEIEQRDFLSGFESNGNISGRPVDVAIGPDGAAYVSDDYAGAIYRVAPGKSKSIEALAEQVNVVEDRVYEPEQQADLYAQGEALYNSFSCASCHVAGLDSLNRMSLLNLGDRYNVSGVMDKIENPTAPMPAYPLDESQREALGVYLLNRE
jgi:glucose/arabinose dehydrogenase